MLIFPIFDPKVGQWLKDSDGNILREKLDNTILETLFPNEQFSFALVDENTTPEDLATRHPAGHKLLFSSGSRYVFGSAELVEKMDTIFPEAPAQGLYGIKDRGAYGALLIGECAATAPKRLNILIVDDETGENGGFLPNEVARSLTGDCHGRISQHQGQDYGLSAADDESPISSQMVQFRSVLPNFDGDPQGPGTHKIAKGTLLAQDFTALPWQLPEGQSPPDLILAKSSFKGGVKPAVGLHQKDIWLGAKAVSERGQMSIASLIPLYPGLLKDIQPRLEPRMAALAAAQNDSCAIAQLYIETSDNRKFAGENADTSPVTRPDSPELQFIRAAVKSGNLAALQVPFAAQELQKFLKNQWKALAFGQDKSVAFDRAMALPDKQLANGEICVSWLPDGAEVICYRPPLINTNGVHLLTNKLTASLPYGSSAQYVAISDQNPGQSVLSDLALDFDGDHVAIALATDYPNLTKEIRQKQATANRYPDLVKEKKQEFEGITQEAASLQMGRSPVGLIANALIAYQSEISAVEILQNPHNSWVRAGDRQQFATEVQKHFSKVQAKPGLATLIRRPNNLSAEGNAAFTASATKIATLAKSITQRNPKQDFQEILTDYQSLLRELVGIASGQNQIAVDMFKSARVADEKAVVTGTQFLAHRSALQQQKKLGNLYAGIVPKATGISPGEILVATTNQYYQASELVQVPPHRFSRLFSDTPYTPHQKARANQYQEHFQQIWLRATARLQKENHESGTTMALTLTDGRSIDVVNLGQGKSEVKYSPERITRVTIQATARQDQDPYFQYQVLDGQGNKIGDLCTLSAQRLSLEPPTTLAVTEGILQSRQQVSHLYFQQAKDLATEFAATIPPEERATYAAALWADATKEGAKNISRAILYAFPDELATQVAKVDMNRVHVRLQGTAPIDDAQQTFQVSIAPTDRGTSTANLYAETQDHIGYISQQGYPVRPGVVTGQLSAGIAGMLELKLPEIPQPLSIGKISDYAWANQPVTSIEQEILIQPVVTTKYRLAVNNQPVSDKLPQDVADFIVAEGLNDGQPFMAEVTTRAVADDYTLLHLNFEDGLMVQCTTRDQRLRDCQGEQVFSIISSPQYTAGVFAVDAAGDSQQIGEFTAARVKPREGVLSPKESLEELVKNGLLQGERNPRGEVSRGHPLKGSIATTATISSDGTNQILAITEQELSPPDWQLCPRPERSANAPVADRLRAYYSQKSPVLLRGEAQSLLAVDAQVGAATADWLERCAVVVIDDDFSDDAAKRGFQMLQVRSDSLSQPLLDKMEQQGLVTVISEHDVYQRLLSKVPMAEELSGVAGINIARDSIDPLGQRIAGLLRENYGADRSLEDMAIRTLEKHPDLVNTIYTNGGSAWLDKCQHQGREDMSGQGRESALIKALATAYEQQSAESNKSAVPVQSNKSKVDKPQNAMAM